MKIGSTNGILSLCDNTFHVSTTDAADIFNIVYKNGTKQYLLLVHLTIRNMRIGTL
jgi:hypothetical protein